MGVLSPLGEKDRSEGDFAKHSIGFDMTPVSETSIPGLSPMTRGAALVARLHHRLRF